MADRDENTARETAFLALIRYAEFGGHERPDAYMVRYGNVPFADMSKHPAGKQTRWGHSSSAAGAYMIEQPTYDRTVQHCVDHDFHPASQDAIAIWLIDNAQALDSVNQGNLDMAFSLLHGT